MSESGGLPDLSTILSRVSENPQAMSMLSSLLGGVSTKPPPSPPPREEEGAAKEEAPQHKEEESAPVFAPRGTRGKSKRHEEKRRLLFALKPFLSKERQSALETLLLVLDAVSLLSQGKEPPCT